MIIYQFATRILIMVKKIIGLVLLLLFKILEVLIIICELLKELIIILHTILYADKHMHNMTQKVYIHPNTTIINDQKVFHLLKNE